MNVAALKTAGGYPMGEVASALQKCIRRGLEKEAVFWAQELESSFRNYVWKRLAVIAHEDIGVADVEAILFFDLCRRQYFEFIEAGSWEYYPLINAVVYLCRAKKTRVADDLGVLIYQNEDFRLEIPDFALDMHTDRGRHMGRGLAHWWEEGAKLDDKAVPSPYTEEAKAFSISGLEKLRTWAKDFTAKVRAKKKEDQPTLF